MNGNYLSFLLVREAYWVDSEGMVASTLWICGDQPGPSWRRPTWQEYQTRQWLYERDPEFFAEATERYSRSVRGL